MAQAVTARTAVPDQTLPVAGWADTTGLSISMLNGSGWIEISFEAQIFSSYAGNNMIDARLTIDGVEYPDTVRTLVLAQNEQRPLAFKLLTKPGAGQHLYRVQTTTSQSTAKVMLNQVQFCVQEPGY